MKLTNKLLNRLIAGHVVAMVMLLIALLAVGGIAGCATISKDERQEIQDVCQSEPACMVAKTTALSEQKEYEAADRLLQHQESYRQTVEYCAQKAGYTMVRDWHCSRWSKQCVPRHWTDGFACVNAAELRRLGIYL